jgi:hypothetical protein
MVDFTDSHLLHNVVMYFHIMSTIQKADSQKMLPNE